MVQSIKCKCSALSATAMVIQLIAIGGMQIVVAVAVFVVTHDVETKQHIRAYKRISIQKKFRNVLEVVQPLVSRVYSQINIDSHIKDACD